MVAVVERDRNIRAVLYLALGPGVRPDFHHVVVGVVQHFQCAVAPRVTALRFEQEVLFAAVRVHVHEGEIRLLVRAERLARPVHVGVRTAGIHVQLSR